MSGVASWAAVQAAFGRAGFPARIALCLCVIGLATGLAFALDTFVPVLSLGALFTLAVLPVAIAWGIRYAAFVAVVSMLAFNYLFLPPTLTFTLHAGENWVVFAVYLVTGLAVSDLAARARRRAQEAERREREAAFLAELSGVLLSGVAVADELPRVAEEAGRLLDAPGARLALGGPGPTREGESAIELVVGKRSIATLYAPSGTSLPALRGDRFLPALASVLGIALDRERLAAGALEAEAFRRSDQLKTALLRSVSHDLRSPLTAIRASLEALQSRELTLDHGQREVLLASALAETNRLDRIVGNLLELSRLQAGAVRAEPQLRPIDGLLDQALAMLPSASTRFTVSIPDGLPLVLVDPIQVEQALVNVLENALKFSPPGSTVSVSVEPGSGELVVAVLDEGPGIAVDELERIFEPFGRGASIGSPKGAGLGLAIVKGFVEANGGRVWAEAGPAGGARILLTLPTASTVVEAMSA